MALEPKERDRLREEFRRFNVDSLSRLYGAIGNYLYENPETIDLYADLPDRKHRPHLLFAAVHYLVLDGKGEDLTRIYETAEADRRVLEEAGPGFAQFCSDNEDDIKRLMSERSVQTNEVNRCIGLLPALMVANREMRKPLALIELGASAGLNLLFDRFRYDYTGGPVIGPQGATVRLGTQLRGRVPRLDAATPPTDFRIGIDLDPVDVNDEDNLLWLRACIFAGDVARDQRLTAAVTLARREWPEVRKGDAVALLPQVVEEVPGDLELCIFNSQMMGWMDESQRSGLADAIKAIAEQRTVWWITFEDDSDVPGLLPMDEIEPNASVLGLQRLAKHETDSRALAWMHPHGAWLDWLDSSSSAW